MRAVMLDRASLGDDGINFSELEAQFDACASYDKTTPEQMAERLADTEVWITNKVKITAQHLADHPQVKLILVVATGTDNVDLQAAGASGVAVANVRAYGTPSVAQHTLMLMLNLATACEHYRNDVKAGRWSQSDTFCLMDHPAFELHGKTLGILGYGELGQAVGRLAEAFGMRLLIWDRDQVGRDDRVSLDHILEHADVITLHCPLTDQTRGLIGKSELARMKSTALLINTARGGIVDELALCRALDSGQIGGAGFDVLTSEPPPVDHPLLQPRPNFILTPHSAWLAREARERMVKELVLNTQAFQRGERRNRVV